MHGCFKFNADMVDLAKTAKPAYVAEILDKDDGQRIDNFLIKTLKGIPKSRIYRAVRNGEVRVNGGRVRVDSRIHLGDKVRIPPVRTAKSVADSGREVGRNWDIPIIYEDAELLVVDKPSGLAVHGGTGHDYGLIEVMQARMNNDANLQLIHRLDRETSGCLMLAKSRKMLLKLHKDMVSAGSVHKQYLALAMGGPKADQIDLRMALSKIKSAEQRVTADRQGRPARSIVHVEKRFDTASLLRIELVTGRMHQARVHCSESGFPIAGDHRYGHREFNRRMKRIGLHRLFLHAERIRFSNLDGARTTIAAPLPESLQHVLESLQPQKHDSNQ